MPQSFRLFWNRRKQWVDVYLHDVHPNTFAGWDAGRWAYYQPNDERGRCGKFGELHFVRIRVRADVVAHELIHLLADWLRSKGREINVYNEERIAMLFDGWTRSFWREWNKVR
jgi:hypothetical protein